MNLSNDLHFLLAASCYNYSQSVLLTLTLLYFPKRSTFLHCKSGWSLQFVAVVVTIFQFLF